jgi:hypothetical protein
VWKHYGEGAGKVKKRSAARRPLIFTRRQPHQSVFTIHVGLRRYFRQNYVSGMVYVNTGYTNAMAGNVLLAFSIGDAK